MVLKIIPVPLPLPNLCLPGISKNQQKKSWILLGKQKDLKEEKWWEWNEPMGKQTRVGKETFCLRAGEIIQRLGLIPCMQLPWDLILSTANDPQGIISVAQEASANLAGSSWALKGWATPHPQFLTLSHWPADWELLWPHPSTRLPGTTCKNPHN